MGNYAVCLSVYFRPEEIKAANDMWAEWYSLLSFSLTVLSPSSENRNGLSGHVWLDS